MYVRSGDREVEVCPDPCTGACSSLRAVFLWPVCLPAYMCLFYVLTFLTVNKEDSKRRNHKRMSLSVRNCQIIHEIKLS